MKKAALDKYPRKQLVMKILEYAVPAIHFILTFFLERKLFIFSGNFDFVNEIARNDYISDKAEMVIVYILSKLVAAIIIWLMWKFVFDVIKGKIDKNPLILFGIIFVIGVVVGAFYTPAMTAAPIDDYTTYSMSIRFLPTYWQSIYTGVAYAGSMMVFPHPFGLFLFKWMAFTATIMYIYVGMEKTFVGKNYKYAALIFFLLPESYSIVFEYYRNNYYAILCLFYFAYIVFTLRNKEKEFKMTEMISVAILSAFIMVWRSEGILFGVGGMLVLLVAYRIKWKKILVLLSVFICAFFVTSSIQEIGSKKYYGEDYMIVNTAGVLSSIFNNPDANLSYEGVEDDLLAIETVVPVQVLREDGLNGYRNYNWTYGRPNFNQSLVDDEAAANYMSAYYRIIYNNLATYLDVQTTNFFAALEIDARRTVYGYTGEKVTFLDNYEYTRWQVGLEEVKDTFLTEEWESKFIRMQGLIIIYRIILMVRDLWNATGINAILHGGFLLVSVLLFVVEASKALIYKEKKSWEYFVYFTVLIGELAALFLFMPVARAAYFYPVLYVSYFLIFFYFAEKRYKNINEKKESV